MKRLLCLVLLSSPVQAQVKNPDTYTYLTISDGDSLDPAYAYDTASHHIILNVYEPLFAYDKSSTAEFVPLVAAKVPSRKNGLISADGRTYTIPIRKGIKFHDGQTLTPEDVRYSLMRFMLQDRAAGPSSLLLEPMTGTPATRDEKEQIKPDIYAKVSRSVAVEGDKVVLRLPAPYAPILSILASWGPIVSREWASKNGDWDGSEGTWTKFNNPKKENSPFFERVNGTGPFKLERWDRKTQEFVLVRNDGYWRKPAALKRAIVKGVKEFGTRKLMLQAGDADAIYATSPEYSQLQNLPGVQIIDDLPTVEMNPVAFFTFKINTVANTSIGSGKLDGAGIPADFFADKDLRKGFAYAFDYPGYIKDVFRGKATQATGCIPASLPGGNTPKLKVHSFDLKKAEEHFKKAWGGQVWEKGFRFTLSYNSGNAYRQTLAQILKRSVESLNPNFKIDVRPVEWPTFLDAYKNSKLPIFVMGWNADFPDAHNFAFPIMHSLGDFPTTQKYKNPEADRLVEAGNAETEPAKRKKIYDQLMALEFEEAPHIPFVNSTRFRTQRDWVQGCHPNPIFPDSPYGCYLYPIHKAERR